MAAGTGHKRVVRVEFDIQGIAPLSFGKAISTVRAQGEDHEAFDERNWKERCHFDDKGEVFVPPMMMKRCLEKAASMLSESVPGKGKATFTKHFLSGILIADPIFVGVNIANVPGERLYMNADGKRGSGTRVWRRFPQIVKWNGHVIVHVLDPLLQDRPEKIFEYAGHAGQFVGLGRFAPRVGGYYGRFTASNAKSFAAE